MLVRNPNGAMPLKRSAYSQCSMPFLARHEFKLRIASYDAATILGATTSNYNCNVTPVHRN